jgi:hypothetical protein
MFICLVTMDTIARLPRNIKRIRWVVSRDTVDASGSKQLFPGGPLPALGISRQFGPRIPALGYAPVGGVVRTRRASGARRGGQEAAMPHEKTPAALGAAGVCAIRIGTGRVGRRVTR